MFQKSVKKSALKSAQKSSCTFKSAQNSAQKSSFPQKSAQKSTLKSTFGSSESIWSCHGSRGGPRSYNQIICRCNYKYDGYWFLYTYTYKHTPFFICWESQTPTENLKTITKLKIYPASNKATNGMPWIDSEVTLHMM